MDTRPGKRYATDLTDPQWAEIEEFLDPPRDPSQAGRPRQYPRRWIADALLYQLRTGMQWRLLPGDLPAWTAVWRQFCRWRDSGVWHLIMGRLLRRCRDEAGRDPQPSVALLDAQSVPSGRIGPPRRCRNRRRQTHPRPETARAHRYQRLADRGQRHQRPAAARLARRLDPWAEAAVSAEPGEGPLDTPQRLERTNPVGRSPAASSRAANSSRLPAKPGCLPVQVLAAVDLLGQRVGQLLVEAGLPLGRLTGRGVGFDAGRGQFPPPTSRPFPLGRRPGRAARR